MNKYFLLVLLSSTVSTTSLQASWLTQGDGGEKPIQHPASPPRIEHKQGEEKEAARQTLRAIAQDNTHEKQWAAVEKLWMYGNKEDKFFIRLALRKIAQDNMHEKQWHAAEKLWCKGSQEDRDIARPVLRAAAQDNTHTEQWDAALVLWWRGNNEDKAFARATFIAMMKQPELNLLTRKAIIRCFRESNDSVEQALGLEWQLHYFPMALSFELQEKINTFDQQKFKATAPKSLESLDHVTMDLPARFETLMNAIEIVDETSPNYMHISAITGNEALNVDNTAAIENLKNNTLGFLKALTNQPLNEGEESGWQMHDENKPAFINALKHLILALETTDDPATRFNNLGIILKGLLYCPTGQVEGINSAVNTLIRGQNQVSGSFEDKVAKIVHDALYTAFLNAFGEGSGVHQLSRARTVLYPHIGLSQAVEGFVERISRVHDEEIPDILQTFYRFFTPQFLSQYVLNHMETAEDRALILHNTQNLKDISAKAQLQRAQQERPLSMMDLYCWLENHRHDPFSGFGFTWDEEAEIGNEYRMMPTVETVQKVLGAMGWINVAQAG